MANPLEDREGRGELSGSDAARLTEQVAGLTSARLPLAPGLRAAAEEMPRGRLRSALGSVSDRLDRGASVDEALAAEGSRLPGHLRGLVSVGSKTGKIGDVLARFVAFQDVGVELRRRIWIGMAYPLLSLAFAVGVFTLIFTGLVPNFEAIFRDFGVSLPWITVAMIRVSHACAAGQYLTLGLLAGFPVIWLLAFVILGGPLRRTLAGGLPVVGVVWRNISLAEFCHLLGLLLECEVPLGEALRLTGGGVRDAALDGACKGVARDVDGGLGFAQALSRQPVFPRNLSRLIRWADTHQSLPESLHMAGEMFEAGARVQSGFAGSVVAVVVVLSIMVGIGLVVIGLFLPLITLISKLSG